MGAQVILMDSNINRLRDAQEMFGSSVGTEVIQDLVVSKRLMKAILSLVR